MLNVVSIHPAGAEGSDAETEDIYAVMKGHMERQRVQKLLEALRQGRPKPKFKATVDRRWRFRLHDRYRTV